MKITTKATAARMMRPMHPGVFLRMEVIEGHGLTVTAAAKILGVARPTLSNLLNARASLAGEMAVRFEKAFGVDMETLLRMQNSFDIAEARDRAGEIQVKRYRPGRAA